MKILLNNYTIIGSPTFSIQINSFPGTTASPVLKIENLLLITKVTTGGGAHQILYNFATDTTNTSVSGNTIISSFVSTLSPSDSLQIYYEWVEGDSIATAQNDNLILMRALLTTLNDLSDSVYNVSERLRMLDSVRDSSANIRVISTGGTITQLSYIIGELSTTSTSNGYLRVGTVTSQHNSAAQININNITP